MKPIRKTYYDDGREPTTTYDGPEIINYDTSHLDAIDGHVSDYDYDEAPQLPAVRPQQSLVLPQQRAAPAANPMAGALQWLMAPAPSTNQQDAYAIQHMQAMSEKSTPMDRNRAKTLLMAWWIALAGLIAWGLNMAELVDKRFAWIVFIVAVIVAVYKSNADENAHSPAGVERHKTDVYGRIRVTEIKAADHANARNHETFNRLLDRVYGGGHVQARTTRQREGRE